MTMRSVYVPMTAEDAATLVRFALTEFRRPSDQAAVLLREALRQYRDTPAWAAYQAERKDRQAKGGA